jgi:acyl carrier protein
MKIADKVVELVAEAFSVDASTLKMETQFGLDLDESLELAELVLRCEEEFDIKLEESEIAQTADIGADRIESRRKAAAKTALSTNTNCNFIMTLENKVAFHYRSAARHWSRHCVALLRRPAPIAFCWRVVRPKNWPKRFAAWDGARLALGG